jgi:hypothetical protein
MMSAPGNWKYESQFLYMSKLARYLARTGRAHTHMLVPDLGDMSWVRPEPGVTLHLLPTLNPPKTNNAIGYVPEMGAIAAAIRAIGPDIIFVTNNRVATLLGTYLEGDGTWRNGSVQVPLILWEGAPAGRDIVERGAESGGWMAAAGYVGATHFWTFSKSTLKAAMTEMREHFGFAAADRLQQRTATVSAIIDREYMKSVVDWDAPKRPLFTVHTGGRWSATKGYGAVAEAVMKLKATGEEIAMLNTGMPGTSSIYEKAVAETGIEVVGGLSQEAMWNLVRTLHVAVLAQDPQAVPGMPIEQLALGLPLLVKSTVHTHEVLPNYPLVWQSTDDLMSLMVELKNNYERMTAECQQWFEEHYHVFDISSVGPVIDDIAAANRGGVSVPLKFDKDDVPDIAARGTTMLFFQQSLFSRTLARREAHRIGLVEKFFSDKPAFEREERSELPTEETDATGDEPNG